MFRNERQFNIISGERKNIQDLRAQSCAEQARKYRVGSPKPTKLMKLGTAKDGKTFQYNYNSEHPRSKSRITTEPSPISTLQPLEKGHAITAYDIITHGLLDPTNRIANPQHFSHAACVNGEPGPKANRKSPLSNIIHAIRLDAPNYRQDYPKHVANREFLRKKGQLCESMCNMEQGYALGKLFRPRK